MYILKVCVGSMVVQDAIMGMNVMAPAVIRLDLADGILCLLDKVQLAGRRTLQYPSNRREAGSILADTC